MQSQFAKDRFKLRSGLRVIQKYLLHLLFTHCTKLKKYLLILD
jgi:hypothetical protein